MDEALPTETYDLAAARDLLHGTFDAQALYRFCLYDPRFRPAHDDFPRKASLADMVEALIEYCDTRDLIPELIEAVHEYRENPPDWPPEETTAGTERGLVRVLSLVLVVAGLVGGALWWQKGGASLSQEFLLPLVAIVLGLVLGAVGLWRPGRLIAGMEAGAGSTEAPKTEGRGKGAGHEARR